MDSIGPIVDFTYTPLEAFLSCFRRVCRAIATNKNTRAFLASLMTPQNPLADIPSFYLNQQSTLLKVEEIIRFNSL